MPAEKEKIETHDKLDLMYQKMFLDDNSMMVRVDRIEKKLDNKCPVGIENRQKINALAWAGGIVTSAIFSVIGFFHWSK